MADWDKFLREETHQKISKHDEGDGSQEVENISASSTKEGLGSFESTLPMPKFLKKTVLRDTEGCMAMHLAET